MKLTQRYETRLETDEIENISATLDAKLEATSPERLVDYISLSIDNLEARKARMKEAKKELDFLIKQDEAQIAIIKAGSSKWLSETGINTLKGDIVSSIKVAQPKEKENLIVINEENLINLGYFKTTLDKTAVKNAIKDGVEIEGAEIEIVHQEQSLTVYKKKSNAAKS